jgi:uncharacterized membrane protein YfcA
MTPIQAAAILVVPSLFTNIWQAAVGGGIFELVRRMWPLLAGICMGTLFGVLLLPHDGNGRQSGSASRWRPMPAGAGKGQFSVPRHAETWLGLLMGTATGAITVATGIFVMPGTPYLQALAFERDKMVQALGISFTTSTITFALALAHTGEAQRSLILPSLVALGAALVGMVLGQLVRGRIKTEAFRLCFFIGLLLLGTHLALRGLL